MATETANEGRPPYPPFTAETARMKVKAAQDAWNTKDPSKVKLAYTADSIWRNRDTFLRGRAEIETFLTAKWARERGYRLRKELFAFDGDRVAVQFWYEWYDGDDYDDDSAAGERGQGKGQWWRTYGLEDWTFAPDGLMRKRQMSANDVRIAEADRWFRDGVDVNKVDIAEKHW
ncbi:putative duf1348-domain-containing protein [Rosellinia necatrix]|uniref:Putative duf1348-domain-containing protein n=1 Tax=Rosellinia necatrix TaxID=77044 RepID=A0A1W2TP90_ROSNE|nr:putative duf1348-domain-containing protein [Rosellinia necatrix]